MTPEGRIKKKLNDKLRALNHVWKFMPVQQGYGLPALDYLLCVGGHFVAIETKALGKIPTPRQEQTIASIRAAGGFVFIVSDDVSLDACIGSLVLLTTTPGLMGTELSYVDVDGVRYVREYPFIGVFYARATIND